MSEDKEGKKDIEVVTGDGSELDVSPVYEHINDVKPKSDEKKGKIIIPGIKEKKEDND